MNVSETVNKIVKFSRVGDWIFALQVSVTVALIYLLFCKNNYFELLVLFIFYHSCFLAYGFILNSVSDLEIDKVAGKDFGVNGHPLWISYTILTLLAIILLFIPILFETSSLFIGWGAFFFATVYSLKPIKLKEKGFVGLLVVSVTVISFPFLFFVSIIGENIALGIYLFFTLFFAQFIPEILHQISDYKSDKKTGTMTWAVKSGLEYVKVFSIVVLALYFACLLLAFWFGLVQGAILISVFLLLSAPLIVKIIKI